MFRRAASVCAGVLLLGVGSPAVPAQPADTAVTVDGVGAAHGLGLAMDGVLGQARAGWKYRQILSLFYVGTKPGKAKGTIRVGLAEGAAHVVELPGGGELSDAGPGERASPGFPIRLPAGASASVSFAGGTYDVRASGVVAAAQTEIVPVPSAGPGAPVGSPPAPSAAPSPTPAPSSKVPDPPAAGRRTSSRSIWVTPSGTPAITRLAATGRRYRGLMQLRANDTGILWAINHVDLEAYVRGIAEEKGAGWPVEGLKVLAVAARSLGASTMHWYTRHHVNGFDICPTDQCQVYLGMDGEEPAMTQAASATAGEIAEFGGRPILAMYHGNGGGRTEAYKLLYGDGTTDPYPYLQSVPYPFANPSRWQRTFTASAVQAGLAAKGIAVPGKLRAIEITERGHSPRVRRIRVAGASGAVEMSGLQFQSALGLPSAWYDVTVGGPVPASPDAVAPADAAAVLELAGPTPAPVAYAMRAARLPDRRRPDILALAVFALALGVGAARYAPSRSRR